MALKPGEFIIELKAQELGLTLENMGADAEAEMKTAIEQMAHAAYAQIVAKAQSDLSTTRLDYLKGLTFEQIGDDTYLITLEGDWPNELEKGFPSFDMKTGMLKSQKIVEVGSRSGKPWVQKGAKGQKYAHVPFEHRPHSKAPAGKDMADAIKQLKAYNRQGIEQKITKIFEDPSGKALEGMVARVSDVSGITDQKVASRLKGLVKYQKKYTNEKTGKETVQAIYQTYRTVSENGQGWRHPGYEGLKAFEEAEKFVERELENILRMFAK